MKFFLCVVIILIGIFLVVALSKVKITVHYQHDNQNDQLTVVIRALYGLITKKINVPVIKMKDSDSFVDYQMKSKGENAPETEKKKITASDIIKSIRQSRKFLRSVIDAKEILVEYCKGIEVRELTWHSSLGTSDAALTGKVAGVAWGVIGWAERIIYSFLTVRCQPAISFVPSFNRQIIETNLRCIVCISIGKTIVTAVKIIMHYKRKGYRFRSSLFMKKESV